MKDFSKEHPYLFAFIVLSALWAITGTIRLVVIRSVLKKELQNQAHIVMQEMQQQPQS